MGLSVAPRAGDEAFWRFVADEAYRARQDLPLDAIPMRTEFDQTGLKKIVFNPVIQPQKKDQTE